MVGVDELLNEVLSSVSEEEIAEYLHLELATV